MGVFPRSSSTGSLQFSKSSEVDVIVYAEFDSEEALAAYKAHRLYEDSIKAVRPLREIRIAADF